MVIFTRTLMLVTQQVLPAYRMSEKSLALMLSLILTLCWLCSPVHLILTNTKVKMGWYIISYDESAKQWYEAVKLISPSVAQTNVNSADGEMQIFMDKDPEKLSETLDINVYRFEFELIPQENKKVRVQYATGPTKRVVRQWGE